MADLVGQTIGRYRIVASLGRGGMAQVYKAYHPGLNRYTAIKVLHGYLADDADFLKRFQREASAVASLRHQNIVQVFDFASQNDIYYMAMEFVKGPSLKEELQARAESNQPLTHLEIGHIMVALGEAINYAHQNGMVHRDLKPGNFMLTDEGQILILDFGIAKIVDATKYTMTGAVTGTPAYMSPEQGQGERGDERSDIYSLGIVLYELVTGRVPFDADTPLAVIIKHMSDPLPLPRAIRSDIPEAIEQVILKALAKEPEDRFQSGAEFAAAIREAIGISPYDTLARNPVYPVFERPTVAELSPSDPTFQAKIAHLSTQVEPEPSPRPSPVLPPPPAPAKRSNGKLIGGIGGGLALLLLIGFLLVRSGFFASGANNVSQPENTATTEAAIAASTTNATGTPTDVPADTATPLAATATSTTQVTTVVPTATELVETTAFSNTSTLTPTKVAVTVTSTAEITTTMAVSDAVTIISTPTETATPTATADADATFEARLNARETRIAEQTVAAAETQTAEAPTATATATPSATPTATDTASPTSTATQTPTPTNTATPTHTPDIEATIEARFNLRATEFAAATQAAIETATASAPTATPIPTATSSPTITPTFTPAHTATSTATLPPTATPTVANTLTNTPIPATPTPSATPTLDAPPISGKLAVPVNNGVGGYNVIIFALPGGQQIAKIENARHPEFRADGLKMLVNGEGGGRDNIWQVDVASWQLERSVSSSPSDYHPFYSPDGQRLVVGNNNLAIGADGNPHPYLFVQCGVRNPQEEGDEKCRELAHFGQLLPTGHIGEIHGENPVWTGDDLIVYKGCNTWQGGNSCGIFRVGSWANKRWSNGETPAKLNGIDGTDTIPTDASGSNFLYHDLKNNDWDVYISATAGGSRNLSNSPGSSDILGTFSPDGQWVAFISNRDGGWAVWVVATSGGTPTRLFNIPWQTPPINHRIERMSWGL